MSHKKGFPMRRTAVLSLTFGGLLLGLAACGGPGPQPSNGPVLGNVPDAGASTGGGAVPGAGMAPMSAGPANNGMPASGVQVRPSGY